MGDIYELWLCKGGKECLRLGECGLRGMGCKLEESWIASKMDNKSENFRGSSCVFMGWGAYVFIWEFREALINKNPKNVWLIRGRELGLVDLGFG